MWYLLIDLFRVQFTGTVVPMVPVPVAVKQQESQAHLRAFQFQFPVVPLELFVSTTLTVILFLSRFQVSRKIHQTIVSFFFVLLR